MNFQKLRFLFFSVVFILSINAAIAQMKFDKAPDGYFRIKSVQAGESSLKGEWDQPGRNNQFKQGDNLGLWSRESTNDQFYRFIPAGDGWYNIVSANKGYVDVAGGKNGDGVNVQMWSPNGTVSQKFRFVHLGEGRWKIFTYWGRVLCTPRNFEDGSNVHTWADHNGPWMEWYIINPQNRKYIPPATQITGVVKTYSIDSKSGTRRTQRVDSYSIDVWYFNPKDPKNQYVKGETIETDNTGKFILPEKYSAEQTLMLLANHPDRETVQTLIYPSRGDRTVEIASESYDAENYILLDTRYRGKKYYYEENGVFYFKNGIITRRDDFFFTDINKRTPSVNALIKELGGNGKVSTDAEMVTRVNSVWSFLKKNVKPSMGTKDPKVTEAMEFLFRNAYNNPAQAGGLKSVKRWPTIEEYADTYAKYGFIPLGNCTSHSQGAATLLYAAGLPADKFFISKFNYDMSWIVEHWVIAVNINNRWYSIDPQAAGVNLGTTPETFAVNPYFTNENTSYDFTKCFEAVLLPGSAITKVPYCGDPAKVRALIAEKNKPEFFIKNKKFTYSAGGMVYSSKGTAVVKKINGNSVDVEISSVGMVEGPKGMVKRSSKFIRTITFKNGIYTSGAADDYLYSGKVDKTGTVLDMSGEQDGFTLTVKK
ncbi:MAG: hypothetical protein CVV49_01560 [Spirochaetae bacterium HGW-Spirochaetae-5]|nr:MAG: hypothetical protein CVV49_01560 [Spirochaetae bacterium HGW-Spirochaetae-5]